MRDATASPAPILGHIFAGAAMDGFLLILGVFCALAALGAVVLGAWRGEP